MHRAHALNHCAPCLEQTRGCPFRLPICRLVPATPKPRRDLVHTYLVHTYLLFLTSAHPCTPLKQVIDALGFGDLDPRRQFLQRGEEGGTGSWGQAASVCCSLTSLLLLRRGGGGHAQRAADGGP